MGKSLLGRNTYLFVNTGVKAGDPNDAGAVWTEADLATDLTVDRSKNEIDATNRGSARQGWTVTQQGLKAFKVEFDSHKPALGEVANSANDTIQSAFSDNSEIEIVVSEGDVNDMALNGIPYTFAICSVGGGSESQPLDDVVTVSFSLTNADIPSEGVVNATTFVPN